MSDVPPVIPPPRRPSTPFTYGVLIFNLAVFLLQTYVSEHSAYPIDEKFALSLPGLKAGYIWQLLTFQVMHAGVLHIFLNSIGIFCFGRPIEISLGGRHFLQLYFLSGVLGGLMQMLGALISPAHFGGAVVGASAGAFGLIAAFSLLYPEQRLVLLLFFVLPIKMKAKTLLWLSTAFALVGMMGVFHDNVAHAAHLGGMFGGLTYVQVLIRRYIRRRQRGEL